MSKEDGLIEESSLQPIVEIRRHEALAYACADKILKLLKALLNVSWVFLSQLPWKVGTCLDLLIYSQQSQPLLQKPPVATGRDIGSWAAAQFH